MESDIAQYIGFLFIGSFITFPAFKKQLRKSRVLANAISTNGVITDLVSVGNNDNYPVVQFATTEGKWITGNYKEATSSAYVNQSVDVLYNSKNPKEFIVTTDIFYRKYNAVNYYDLVGIIFFTAGVIGIINHYR